MKSYIILPFVKRRIIPEEFQDDDNRSVESLVEYFIHHFSKPGDTVFDPFAGFGTTLLVSEDMGRIPFGIEADEQRYEFIRSQLFNKENILHGDSRGLDKFTLPSIDFVFTSPIFMRSDETKNPLSGFKEKGTYQMYLDDLQDIFRKVRTFLKPGAKVVVDVYNLQATETRPMTFLAWDMARAISGTLKFEREIVICWQGEDRGDSPQLSGYDHSYCLVFDSE
ncbi:MAG: DNA methyltransferase [Candidatus Thorarchaeota archaeon]|jgi:DNA modification methylase